MNKMITVLLATSCLAASAGILYSNITFSTVTSASIDKSNRVVYVWSNKGYSRLEPPVVTGHTYQVVYTNMVSPGHRTNWFSYSNSIPLYYYASTSTVYGTVTLTDGSSYDQYREALSNVWIATPARRYMCRIVLRGNWVQIDVTQRDSGTTIVVPWSKISSVEGPVSQFVEWPYGDP